MLMTGNDAAEQVVKSMLGHLGFEVDVTFEEGEEMTTMQLSSSDSSYIIGKNGDRLEDIQYLVNRITSIKDESAPRIKVDCDGYRATQESQLLEKTVELAYKVQGDGRPARTRPLNAYYRRLVHNALKDIEGIETTSPEGKDRYKRITIKPVE